MAHDAQLNGILADLAGVLVSDFDLGDLLHRLADTCIGVCGASGAGILVADQDGVLRDVAYSSESIRQLERVQLAAAEGPCVECFQIGALVQEPDLAAAAARWPSFAPAALGLGIGSALALPLRLRGRTVGALNLFHTAPGLSSADVLRAAQALADLAMVGIVQYGHGPDLAQSVEDHVRTALVARSLIERAKGFLAEQGNISMDAAFLRMRDYADAQGLGLTRVAEDLSSRVLPADAVLGSG
ncbi:GAF and ANTAR domain-containing protein [Streptacidiphilus sp. PAMC 29251]